MHSHGKPLLHFGAGQWPTYLVLPIYALPRPSRHKIQVFRVTVNKQRGSKDIDSNAAHRPPALSSLLNVSHDRHVAIIFRYLDHTYDVDEYHLVDTIE